MLSGDNDSFTGSHAASYGGCDGVECWKTQFPKDFLKVSFPCRHSWNYFDIMKRGYWCHDSVKMKMPYFGEEDFTDEGNDISNCSSFLEG